MLDYNREPISFFFLRSLDTSQGTFVHKMRQITSSARVIERCARRNPSPSIHAWRCAATLNVARAKYIYETNYSCKVAKL